MQDHLVILMLLICCLLQPNLNILSSPALILNHSFSHLKCSIVNIIRVYESFHKDPALFRFVKVWNVLICTETLICKPGFGNFQEWSLTLSSSIQLLWAKQTILPPLGGSDQNLLHLLPEDTQGRRELGKCGLTTNSSHGDDITDWTRASLTHELPTRRVFLRPTAGPGWNSLNYIRAK